MNASTADLADVVSVLAERALAVSAQATRPLTSVRVVAGDVQVELAWPAGTPAVTLPVADPHTPAAPTPAAPTPAETGLFPLCSDMVGMFYRASEPGRSPFVSEGDTVVPGQQVGIVEAMKLMIPVTADRAGRVVELLVADAQPVEHGQPLMLLSGAER